MIKISLIVAAAQNNAIGLNNKMLWHLPNDLRFFKNKTWGLPLIMGRRTFESLGKALPGRTNIIITRNHGYTAPDAVVVNTLQAAIDEALKLNSKEIFISGGGEIYKQALPLANTMYITRVAASPEADAFFPEFDDDKWIRIEERKFSKDDKHAFDYSFEHWVTK